MTGYCKWCGKWQKGHLVQSCNYFQSALAKGSLRAVKLKTRMETGSGRVCAACADPNHSSTVCPKKFDTIKANLARQKEDYDKAFEWLHEIGFGPGAMLNGMASEYGWRSKGKSERLVVIEEFGPRAAQWFMSELAYGKQRNWYMVNAVDTENEKVRKIYLPFHSVYAPKPTSKNVSIVHRANPEDIEKMKSHFDCYKNEILNYDSADAYFSTGKKLKAGTSLSA